MCFGEGVLHTGRGKKWPKSPLRIIRRDHTLAGDDDDSAGEETVSHNMASGLHRGGGVSTTRTQSNNSNNVLYAKSDALLDFLSSWDCVADTTTVPAWMECLWMDLYEQGYIQANDVKLLQSWLTVLSQIGYEFPPLSKRR